MKKILASALTLLLALGCILTPSVVTAASMPQTEDNQAESIANFDYLQLDDSLINDGFDVARPTISVRSNQTDGGSGGGQKDTTGWILSGKYYYNKKAEKFTVGSISIAVSALIPWKRVTVVTQIANLYYQLNTPNIYSTRLYYYKYKKGAHGSLLPYQEKAVVKFYKDKKRTKKIKTVTRITKK